ncbi:bifunctional DNA primase/polymerase [Kitasatospora sp. NPDC006697]|uniref:bifunctional DNA primase/polymerase n=1 Tax=Kitasatospora sp. NPDC006697 TaxID=3364020 RepID=UPI0036A59345
MTNTPDTAVLMTAALAAADRGWHVFPLTPGAKRPAVVQWEQRATTDPDRIRRCWTSGPYNIGIACGPSHLVVVDLDVPKPGHRPPADWDLPGITDGTDVFAELAARHGLMTADQTFRVRTGSGGRHLYYRAPEVAQRSTIGSFGWCVDTRAAGGYVVAPGSVVDGRPYPVELDVPLLPLPDFLLISKRSVPTATRTGSRTGRISDPTAWANAALDRECDKVATTTEGGRNHALLGAARSLARMIATRTLTRAEVENRLMDAAHAAGLHDKEAARTIRSGLDWGLTHTTARPAA